MQHVVKYPWIEYFYEPSVVTFWFKLTPEHASILTPNNRNKISKVTGVIFETRQQQVFGVHGYVADVYATMEKITAKLHVEMPSMLIDLMKKDDEKFGMPRPWATPVPPHVAPNVAAANSFHSAAVAATAATQQSATIATRALTSSTSTDATHATNQSPVTTQQHHAEYPPRPSNPLPQQEIRDTPAPEVHPPRTTPSPAPTRTPTAAVIQQPTSSTAVVVASRANPPQKPAIQYRSAKIRSLTGRIMGFARDDFVQQLLSDKKRWLERCPIQVISLENGPRAALIECDRTAARIGSPYATAEANYDNQMKLFGLCQTLYCHFRACMDHNQLPEANRVIVVKNLRPSEGQEHIFAMFYRCYDVIYKRRPPPDLSKELVAYVVYPTAAQATAAVNADNGTNLTVEPLESYGYFKEQYSWRVEFLRRLVTGEGCRPAFMRAKGCWAKTAFKKDAPPPVEQSECADLEDDWISETLDDLESTTTEIESVAPLEDIEAPIASSGRVRLAPFPEETASTACRISVPHRTLTWMLYNALDHRWKPETVKSASEHEYVRWNDEQVLHVCDSICDAYPSFFGSVRAKLRRYDRIYGGKIAYKFERFRGDRLWERVDMFNSRKQGDILNMPRRFEWHVHEITQAGDLLGVIEDLKRLRSHFLPVVTLDTEGCSSGERRGCRLLQLCTPLDAYLIDVWLLGGSCEFSDLMAYLFAQNNGLCRFGFHFDATPKRLSGDRKKLATLFDTHNACNQAVRQLIMRDPVHDVRQLVAQAKGLNEAYVKDRPRLSHFCLYVLGRCMDKSEQKSCWGVDNLRPSQKKYAIMDAVIPLLIVEECRRMKPTTFEEFRRMTTSATWNGAEDADDDWWLDVPARASVAYKAANQ